MLVHKRFDRLPRSDDVQLGLSRNRSSVRLRPSTQVPPKWRLRRKSSRRFEQVQCAVCINRKIDLWVASRLIMRWL